MIKTISDMRTQDADYSTLRTRHALTSMTAVAVTLALLLSPYSPAMALAEAEGDSTSEDSGPEPPDQVSPLDSHRGSAKDTSELTSAAPALTPDGRSGRGVAMPIEVDDEHSTMSSSSGLVYSGQQGGVCFYTRSNVSTGLVYLPEGRGFAHARAADCDGATWDLTNIDSIGVEMQVDRRTASGQTQCASWGMTTVRNSSTHNRQADVAHCGPGEYAFYVRARFRRDTSGSYVWGPWVSNGQWESLG